MAYFNSPCTRAMLMQTDAAPMPRYIQSTYQTDYISPMVRRREKALQAMAGMPPDYLDENAGKRILPTTFKEVYQNTVSASIGDRLELQFSDDTPQWKKINRAAAAAHWLRPLDERRRFVETMKTSGIGGGGGSGGGGGGGGGEGMGDGGDGGGEYETNGCGAPVMMDGGFMPGDRDISDGGNIGGVVDGVITEIPDENFANGCACGQYVDTSLCQ